jgi:hypothetical protein
MDCYFEEAMFPMPYGLSDFAVAWRKHRSVSKIRTAAVGLRVRVL